MFIQASAREVPLISMMSQADKLRRSKDSASHARLLPPHTLSPASLSLSRRGPLSHCFPPLFSITPTES